MILHQLKECRQENKEQLATIKEEMIKVNARLDDMEGRVGKAEERIQNASYYSCATTTLQAGG